MIVCNLPEVLNGVNRENVQRVEEKKKRRTEDRSVNKNTLMNVFHNMPTQKDISANQIVLPVFLEFRVILGKPCLCL